MFNMIRQNMLRSTDFPSRKHIDEKIVESHNFWGSVDIVKYLLRISRYLISLDRSTEDYMCKQIWRIVYANLGVITY